MAPCRRSWASNLGALGGRGVKFFLTRFAAADSNALYVRIESALNTTGSIFNGKKGAVGGPMQREHVNRSFEN